MAQDVRQRQLKAGFTLVELMIVVGIVGIMASITGPNLSRYVQSTRNKAELRKVGNAITHARNKARAGFHCVIVTVNASSIVVDEKEDITGDSTICTGTSAYTRTFSYRADYLQAMTGFSSGNPIVFNERGGVDGTVNPTSMTVTSKDGIWKKTITVWPALGTVRVN